MLGVNKELRIAGWGVVEHCEPAVASWSRRGRCAMLRQQQEALHVTLHSIAVTIHHGDGTQDGGATAHCRTGNQARVTRLNGVLGCPNNQQRHCDGAVCDVVQHRIGHASAALDRDIDVIEVDTTIARG